MAGKHAHSMALLPTTTKKETRHLRQDIMSCRVDRTHADIQVRIDEPRRSGRATKGQHKNLELVQDLPSKKGKAKGQSKEKSAKPSAEPTPTPSEQNEEEIIRCICGEYEEEEDIERDMICCDQCSAWQHNDCMGLTFAKGEEPEEYFCEQCKPENHKELLEKMARGEKPWEEVARRRQQEIEEKKAAKRKKGKKGKKGGARPSDIKAETSAPSTPAPSETPAAPSVSRPSVEDKTPAPAPSETITDNKAVSNQKRKFDEHQEPSTPDSVSSTMTQAQYTVQQLIDMYRALSKNSNGCQSREDPLTKRSNHLLQSPGNLAWLTRRLEWLKSPKKSVAQLAERAQSI